MTLLYDPPMPSIADLLRQLGDIPPGRVRSIPPPGTATREDLLKPENFGCELVDGTLVEKAMGHKANRFGAWLLAILNVYVDAHNLGYCTGEQGFIELPDGPVRGPDIAFFAWDRLENRRPPDDEPIPTTAPDLVVEVLSPGNTPAEMERKRAEYFRGGVQLYWEFDPETESARTYSAFAEFSDLTPNDVLDGGTIIPGFSVPMKQLWAKHRATGNS